MKLTQNSITAQATYLLTFLFAQFFTLNTFATEFDFFEGSWNQALIKAAEEKKFIFVDAYTEHCLPCKMLDRYVFTNEEVIQYYKEHFISVKMDVEKQENADFTSTYKVDILPTLLYFSPDGKYLTSKTGSQSAFEFLQQGAEIVENYNQPQLANYSRKKIKFTQVRLNDLSAMYDGGTRYHKFMNEYAYVLKRFHRPYNTIVNEYLKSQKDKLRTPSMRQFIFDFAINLENNAVDYLVKDLVWFKENHGGNIINERIKDAVHNGIITAIRLRDDKIFKKSLDIIKKARLPHSEAFTFEMETAYYQGVGDWAAYARMTSKYLESRNVTDAILLNDIAWNFYRNVNNEKMLKKALKWVKKSIKIENEYYNNHTHASLLYRLGNVSKAKKAADEAVQIARKKGNNYKETLRLIDNFNSKNGGGK